jgi:pyruvate dehydrogenase (quinone)
MASTAKQAMNGLQTAIQNAISQKGVAVLRIHGDLATAEIEDIYTAGKNFHADPI